ncbi:MAG: tetratricopeptide repeat protein, partial [Burkholderiales bacterium]
REDWAAAQAAARRAVERSPGSADAHNLYAYSMRKGPHPQMDLVFRHYNEALRLEPRHRGAHEYIGEAYLMTGNLAKAKEHLAQLERLCAAGCAEQAALARGISLFERQHAKN